MLITVASQTCHSIAACTWNLQLISKNGGSINKWEGGGSKASLIKCAQDKNKKKKKIYTTPWEKNKINLKKRHPHVKYCIRGNFCKFKNTTKTSGVIEKRQHGQQCNTTAVTTTVSAQCRAQRIMLRCQPTPSAARFGKEPTPVENKT